MDPVPGFHGILLALPPVGGWLPLVWLSLFSILWVIRARFFSRQTYDPETWPGGFRRLWLMQFALFVLAGVVVAVVILPSDLARSASLERQRTVASSACLPAVDAISDMISNTIGVLIVSGVVMPIIAGILVPWLPGFVADERAARSRVRHTKE
jgi:hypothetical protein